MKKQVIMTETDILQTIANSFGTDVQNVSIRHYKETVGQGYSSEEIDRVEITVNLPMAEQR